MSGRTPNFDVTVWHKPTATSGTVGVAWIQDDGRISIKLNPGAMLQFDPDTFINLFPKKEKGKAAPAPKGNPDDDVPF